MRAIKFKNLTQKNTKFNINSNFFKLNQTKRLFIIESVKRFSTTDTKPDITTLNNILFQTKEDKDLKYEDECFYLEKEWKKLEEDKIKKKQDYMTKDLTEHQKRECDILIEKIIKFNAFESRYFSYVFKDLIDNNAGVSPCRPNVFEKRSKFVIDLSRPEDNPNYKLTQEVLSALIPFISSGYFSGGGAATNSQKQSETTKAEEPKQEKVVEKVLVIIYLIYFTNVETDCRYQTCDF